MRHFVFGYGSLISRESRQRTGDTGAFFPAIVSGLRRRWARRYAMDPRPAIQPGIGGHTALGVELTGSASDVVGGVVFEVDPLQLPQFDRREGGYTRHALQPHQIAVWPVAEPAAAELHKAVAESACWVYCVKPELIFDPTPDFPILHSYLDVILHGALDVSDDFAKHFVENTLSWTAIVDDRTCPLYVRHSATAMAAATAIDDVVRRFRPEALKLRVTAQGLPEFHAGAGDTTAKS